MLLRVLVIPLVWRRDNTGLSSRSSRIGILSRACISQDTQSGIFLSCAYLSLVTERSARTSRAPNIAPANQYGVVKAAGTVTLLHFLRAEEPYWLAKLDLNSGSCSVTIMT